jgi:hypothetical protein
LDNTLVEVEKSIEYGWRFGLYDKTTTLCDLSDGIQGTQKPEIATYLFGKLLGK